MTGEWKALEAEDIGTVCAIAAKLHPGLPERAEVFAEKLGLFPAGCRKLVLEDRMIGYGIGHPWTLCAAPKLDAFLGGLPAEPDCLYLHDGAILPEGRGGGAAGGYIGYMEGLARDMGLAKLALVSVYGTMVLWGRYGFNEVPVSVPLSSYGPTAAYMVKEL